MVPVFFARTFNGIFVSTVCFTEERRLTTPSYSISLSLLGKNGSIRTSQVRRGHSV